MGNKSPHSILLFFMLMSLQSSILCTNNSIQTENNFNSTQTENNFNSTQTNSPFNSTPSIKPRSKHLKSNGQNRNLIAERLASKQILLSSDLETVDNGSQQNIKNKSIWLMIAGSSFLVVGVIGGFLTVLTRKKAYTDLTKVTSNNHDQEETISYYGDLDFYANDSKRKLAGRNDDGPNKKVSISSVNQNLVTNEYFYNVNIDDHDQVTFDRNFNSYNKSNQIRYK